MHKTALTVAALAVVALGAAPVWAEAPDLKTPEPVIYLADNLDEKDGLGWCIDTLGRGFSEQLQVHSCKPQGGDVQFSYDPQSQQIRSVEFDGKCATLSAPEDAAVPFGLLDCAADDPAQKFSYRAEAGQFSPADQPELCLTAGEASRSAGPFMSRSLILASCADTPEALTHWMVRPAVE